MKTENNRRETGRPGAGFTLIELMISVAIVGVLVAIAIPVFNYYRQRAFNSAALSHIHFIKNAEANYWVAPQAYIGVPPGDGPGPTGILPNTTVPSGVGYVVGVFPVTGADAVTGNPTGTNYVAFTGHIRGDQVYGVDSRGDIYWRSNAAGVNPAADAKGEDTTRLIPAGWGNKL